MLFEAKRGKINVKQQNYLEFAIAYSIMLHFENVNGLEESKSGYNSEKGNRLRRLWSKHNSSFVSLLKTKINPLLLSNKESLQAKMFKNQLNK